LPANSPPATGIREGVTEMAEIVHRIAEFASDRPWFELLLLCRRHRPAGPKGRQGSCRETVATRANRPSAKRRQSGTAASTTFNDRLWSTLTVNSGSIVRLRPASGYDC